jgi:hypothetical protein
MPSLTFGTSAYSRLRGNLPELPLINMFVEAAPSAEAGVVLQSRPALVEQAEYGIGPVRGLYQADGVLGGDLVTVSAQQVFRDDTLLGVLGGTGPVSFAADEDEIVINAGAGLYRSTGLTLVQVDVPDDANFIKLVDTAGYFIGLREGTQQFYFSAVLDGSSWGALDFASTENEPDPGRDAVVLNDTIAFLGSQTVEFWAKTGDPDVPFAPIEGRVFQKGVIATGCACKFDNSFAWIGNNRIVYTAGNVPDRISDAGIEERLAHGTGFALFSFYFEGHEFLAARIESVVTAEHQTGTWLYDAQTRQWCEWQSYGRANWRARCATNDGLYFGDDETGTIWEFGSGYVDAGGVLERRFRAGLTLNGWAFSADKIRLTTNVGETVDLVGDYANPMVEMRTSRDGGRTWGNWRPTAMGAQGNYRTRAEWRRCGMFDDPGLLVEFRCADPVPFRVSGVSVNEQGGGRSR